MSRATELSGLGRYRVTTAVRLAALDPEDGIAASTLLAIASRETNMRNIVGGGRFIDGEWKPDGSDRGIFQISSTYHAAFLRSVIGCPSGSWSPDDSGLHALHAGYVPQFTTACQYAINMLAANVEYAEDAGVKEGQRVRFAIAAYNAGRGGALAGYREGDVDSRTTGKDYSADVLRRRSEVQTWLVQHGYIS